MVKQSEARKPVQIERDRKAISVLYLKGIYQSDIAEELNISQSTVSRDIKVLQAEWKIERVHDINEKKLIELEKLDVLEMEYWAAWKRSQEDAVEQTVKQGGTKGTDLKAIEATKKTKGQVGDARFLDGVVKCITKRCQILGIDAPVKFEGKQLIGVLGLGLDLDLV